MIQFNLEEYLKNPKRKVITKNGQDVRIICTDKKGTDFPIVALCSNTIGPEVCRTYSADGSYSEEGASIYDLFFAPQKCEGWVNVYRDEDKYRPGASYLYPSEQEAKANAPVKGGYYKYVATVKIEWEE